MRLSDLIARRRQILACGFIGLLVVPANITHAQQVVPALQSPKQTGEGNKTQPARMPNVDVRTVDTSPAAEPQPAFKYRFWPNWNEIEPGNSVPLYVRAVLQLAESEDQERWRSYSELFEHGVPEPSDSEGMQVAREWLKEHGNVWVFAEMRRATYREEADFGHRIESLRGTEPFSFLLPELHKLRDLARLLDIRIRIAIADGDFNEAIASIRDGFRLAGTLRESRLLISQLVGAAINGVMLEDVRLLSEAPGAPNLYWALASIPRPLTSMHYAVTFEVDLAERLLPEGDSELIGVEAWNKYLADVVGDAYQYVIDNYPQQPWARRMIFTAGVMQAYPHAKSALIADGIPEATVEAMPASEAVVRYARRQLKRAGDDLQKWMYLPPEVQQLTEASRKDPVAMVLKQHPAKFDPVRILVELLPSIPIASRAGLRTQAQLDALMTVEAMRAYAAVNGGRLPERLSDLEPLPALPDPRTSEPFEWEVRTSQAVAVGVLRLPDIHQPGMTREYHVRIHPIGN